MNSIEIFDTFALKYDQWFDKYKFVYESEIIALKKFIPKNGNGLEIGVGTGRFAVPLGIRTGVEPAHAMADIARRRGIDVYYAKGEKLPFSSESFSFILFVTTVCFLENPMESLREATRVLMPDGYIIIGMIDAASPLGKVYEKTKTGSTFYRHARFYTVSQVTEWLKALEYKHIKTCQTIFHPIEEITTLETVKRGYGEGSFVAIAARKRK